MHNGFWNIYKSIGWGLIKTYLIDKVVSYVQRKLNLTDEDIDIDSYKFNIKI